MTGTIARVMDKGFGFITPDDGQKDIFFHANAVQGVTFDEIREGDKVTFDVEEGPKGPAATNVRIGGEAAPAADTPAEDATVA